MAGNGKITVLFVCGSPFEGAERSLYNLIVSLKDVITPIVLLPSKGDAYKHFIEIGVKCIVHSYQTVFDPLNYWLWVFLHPWRMRMVKHFRYDIRCLLMVKKALKNSKIDIVHSNNSYIVLGCKLAAMLKAKHVWHIREYMNPNMHTKAINRMGFPRLRKLVNNADGRIVVSNACCEHWDLVKEKTWVIRDAVRSVNDCCFEKTKQPYFLFCSKWMTKAKGAGRVVSAYGMSGVFTVRLKMVGDCEDDYMKDLMALAESYNCVEYIDFIPAQIDVKSYFANAMAFIQPSVNEGMGRTTAEAMFYGCPVIAYASGGTLDLVKDGETGYLFNSVEECAKLMKKVCTTNQEEIILQAQSYAKENLSIENYGNKIMEVYNKVLCKNF